MVRDLLINSTIRNLDNMKSELPSVCAICGNPATGFVDRRTELLRVHIEQVYEHQGEDYASRHLLDNEW